MTFNLLFTTLIYSVLIFVAVCAIKVYTTTIKCRHMAKNTYGLIETLYNEAKTNGIKMKEQASFANNFEKLLFYRFFEITKQLIDLQKFLINSN